MPLTATRVAELLRPYTAAAPDASVDWPRVHTQLIVYLHLLMKWNARINLTAIHSPEEIVRRHFGESLFAGLHLVCSTWNKTATAAECSTWNTSARPDSDCSTWNNAAGPAPHAAVQGDLRLPASVLDFGSGAGFPGLPIQILWPEIQVTLAEARHKKASFLREAIRCLGLQTEVWADRVESMPAEHKFPVVTMRAVDQMNEAVAAAAGRTSDALLILGTTDAAYPFLAAEFSAPELTPIPETNDGVLMLFRRI